MTEQILGFKKEWAFPPRMSDFLRKDLEPPTLHICCGSSDIGTVRIDIEDEMFPDVQSDMFSLPIRNESFPTVFVDPPWALGMHLRPSLIYELRRVCKVGGALVINAPWQAQRLKGCKLIRPFLVSNTGHLWGNIALVIRYIKISNSYDNLHIPGYSSGQERLFS